jgi:hypothetical protein
VDNFNNVDKSDKYLCPPFKDNCIEPNYDSVMEFYKGIIYSVIPSVLFWIGILYFIKWL